VDIRSESEFAAEEAEHGYEEEEVQGRCAAILSNGRRCPNASLSGSRYCGLESHQALARIDSDQIADLTPTGEGPTEPAEQPTEAPAAQTTAEDPAPGAGDATAPGELPAEGPAAQAHTEEQTP